MKRLLTTLFLVISLCSCQKDIETSYFLITYTPPISDYNTPPKVTFKQVEYSNDSVAFFSEQNRILSVKKGIIEFLSKESSKGQAEDLTMKLNRQALESILSEKNTLMCLTYVEDYDVREFIEMAKKYGVKSEEVKKYIEDNKLTVNFYPLD